MPIRQSIRAAFKDTRQLFKLPGFAGPAVAGILAMLLGALGMWATKYRAFQGDVIPLPVVPSIERQVAIYQAKLAWVVAACMLCLAMVGSIWCARRVALAVGDEVILRQWKRITTGLGIIAGLLAITISWVDCHRGDTALWGILRAFSDDGGLLYAIHAIDGFAAVPMIHLCMGAGLLAHAATLATKPFDTDRMQNVVSGLRVLLYMGCATLVCGVIEVLALYNLLSVSEYRVTPGGLMSSAAVAAVGRGLALAIGVGFSTFLTAIYVPAALQLRRSATELACAELPKDKTAAERYAWLLDHDFIVSPASAISRVVVLLGPVLAALLSGPVLELVARLAAR